MNTNTRILIALGSALGCLAAAPGAFAQSSKFTAPAFFGQAGTTYQEWDGYSSPAGPNAPTFMSNAAGTANWYDTTASTDGAFLIGSPPNGHVYSFSGVLNPAIPVPGLGLGPAYFTTLVLQIETQGNPIDTSSVKVTPAGGTAFSYNSSSVTVTPVIGGFGGNDDVYQFTWNNLPGSATGYTFNYSAGTPSVSHIANRVDTLSTLAAAPEPAPTVALWMGILGLTGLALRARRRAAC